MAICREPPWPEGAVAALKRTQEQRKNAVTTRDMEAVSILRLTVWRSAWPSRRGRALGLVGEELADADGPSRDRLIAAPDIRVRSRRGTETAPSPTDVESAGDNAQLGSAGFSNALAVLRALFGRSRLRVEPVTLEGTSRTHRRGSE